MSKATLFWNLRLQLKGLSTCDSLKQAKNDTPHEGFMEIILKILLRISGSQKVSVIFMKMNRKGCIPRNIRQRVRQGRGSGWSWIFKGGTSTFVWMSTPIRPPPSLRLSEGSPQNLAAIDKFFRIPLSLKPLKSFYRCPWQICWIENSSNTSFCQSLILGILETMSQSPFPPEEIRTTSYFPLRREEGRMGWGKNQWQQRSRSRVLLSTQHPNPQQRSPSISTPSSVAHAGKNSEARDGF